MPFTRLGGGPSGAAGGVLGGSYPSPVLATLVTPTAIPAPFQITSVGTTQGTTGGTNQGYRKSLLQLIDLGTASINDALIDLELVYQGPAARTISDGVITGTALTSATAAFTNNDVGASLSGANIPAPRTVTDAVFNGTTTVTSATANFVNSAYPAGDVGRPLSPSGSAPATGGPAYSVLQATTTIASVSNSTTAIMSLAALTSATGFGLTIGATNTIASVTNATTAVMTLAGTNGSALTLTITPIIKSSGLYSQLYTPPDNGGDTSPVAGIQSGGGTASAFYKLAYIRPTGLTDYSSSAQGALEAGTGDQSQAILAISGNRPQNYINAGMTVMASNALKARIDNPVSKGILVSPSDGNFDTRVGIAIGTQVLNGADSNIKFSVLLNGTGTLTGAGQASVTPSTVNNLGGSFGLLDTGTASNNGGMLLLGAGANYGVALKYNLLNNANNGQGTFAVYTRNLTTDATLTQRMAIAASGDVTFNGSGIKITAVGHIVGGNPGGAISVANGGGIGGGSPSTSITGTDTAHQVTILTGTGPTADGVMATVTFGLAFAAAPKAVVIVPANAAAAALSTVGAGYTLVGDIGTGSYSLRMKAPAATTTYIYYVTVIG